MSNVYSLADMKRDIEREFAPVQIDVGSETLTLRNLMRVSASERKAVMGALKQVEQSSGKNEDSLDPEEMDALASAVETILANVTADGKGPRLVQEIDGDLALSMKIMDAWMEATQPGEAQNSPASSTGSASVSTQTSDATTDSTSGPSSNLHLI